MLTAEMQWSHSRLKTQDPQALCVVACAEAEGTTAKHDTHDYRTMTSSNNEQQVFRQWVVAVVGHRPAATCDTLSWHEL